MPTAAPKASLRRELARSETRSARPSNSAGWRKGKPISTRASPPHRNGTSRPATRLSRQPAAGSRTRKAPRCGSAKDRRVSSCRNLSPGAIHPPHPAHNGHTLLLPVAADLAIATGPAPASASVALLPARSWRGRPRRSPGFARGRTGKAGLSRSPRTAGCRRP